MPSIQIKADGAFKKVKPHVKVGSSWKKVKNAYINISGTWKKTYGNELPIGIILPYLADNNIPSGFSRFELADDRFIVGAGSTFSVGDMGGDKEVSISATTSSTGAHTGSGSVGGQVYAQSSYGNLSAGNHNHTVLGVSGDVRPEYKKTILIKALEEIEIPKNAGIFGVSTFDNFSEVSFEDRFLLADSIYNENGGVNGTISISCTTSTSGTHTHANIYNHDLDDESTGISATRGGHSHTISMQGSLKLPSHVYLSVWENLLNSGELTEGMIGLWEGDVAPEGWNICDGTNNTPDMRDYFLRIGDSSSHGTVHDASSSTNTFSGTTNSGIAHNHATSSGDNDNNLPGKHSANTTTGSHTATDSVEFTPKYYALTFIMKEQ